MSDSTTEVDPGFVIAPPPGWQTTDPALPVAPATVNDPGFTIKSLPRGLQAPRWPYPLPPAYATDPATGMPRYLTPRTPSRPLPSWLQTQPRLPSKRPGGVARALPGVPPRPGQSPATYTPANWAWLNAKGERNVWGPQGPPPDLQNPGLRVLGPLPPGAAPYMPKWWHATPSQPTPQQISQAYVTAGRQYGIPWQVLRAVAQVESGGRTFDQNGNLITSSAGAQGMMQFMPATARQYGVNPADPVSSIFGAARYLRDLLNRNGGNWAAALQAYNGATHDPTFAYYNKVRSALGNILRGGPEPMVTPSPRGPSEWGRPVVMDPAVPGSMPTPRDVPRIMAGAPALMAISALASRLPMGLALYAYGLLLRARGNMQYQEAAKQAQLWKEHLEQHDAMQTLEGQEVGDAMIEFDQSKDPDDLRSALIGIGSKFSDPVLVRMAERGDFAGIQRLVQQRDLLNQPLSKLTKGFQAERDEQAAIDAHMREYQAQNPLATPDDLAIERERYRRELETKPGAGAKVSYGQPQSYEVVKDGKPTGQVIQTVERKDQPGLIDVQTGKPPALEPGESLVPYSRAAAGAIAKPSYEEPKTIPILKDGKVVRYIRVQSRRDQPGEIDLATGKPAEQSLGPGESFGVAGKGAGALNPEQQEKLQREQEQDAAVEAQLQAWEQAFRKRNGRDPTPAEIATQRSVLRAAEGIKPRLGNATWIGPDNHRHSGAVLATPNGIYTSENGVLQKVAIKPGTHIQYQSASSVPALEQYSGADPTKPYPGKPWAPPPGDPDVSNPTIWTAALYYAETGHLPPGGRSVRDMAMIRKALPVAMKALGITDLGDQLVKYNSGQIAAETIARNFGSGQAFNTMMRVNTTAGHIELFRQYSMALDNNYPANFIDNLRQRLGVELGNPHPTNWTLTKSMLVDEITTLMSPGGGSAAERERLEAAINRGEQTKQLMGAANTFAELGRSRVEALAQAYVANNRATGLGETALRIRFAEMMTEDALQVYGDPLRGFLPYQDAGNVPGADAPDYQYHPPTPSPAPRPVIPPRPKALPPGSQYSPSRNEWRDPSGKLYNADGTPVSG